LDKHLTLARQYGGAEVGPADDLSASFVPVASALLQRQRGGSV